MYEDLVLQLRKKAAGYNAEGVFDTSALLMQASDVIEQLEHTITLPHPESTVKGYPLDELLTFALLCRRHDITEDDLHDFCTNAVRGFEAGMEDLRRSAERAWEETCEEFWSMADKINNAVEHDIEIKFEMGDRTK